MAQHNDIKLQASQRNSIPPSELLSRSWHLREAKQGALAAELCRAVLSDDPGNGQAWHLLGLLSWDLQDSAQAITHLKQAVSVEPDQPLHYNNLGVVLKDLDCHEEAAVHFRKALEIKPDYLDAKNNLGLALLHQGNLESAAAIFEEIVGAESSSSAAWSNMGLIRLTQQDYPEAIAHYRNAIAIDGRHPQWHGNLGAAFSGMGRFDQAEICFRKELEMDSNDSGLKLNLAIALRNTGQHAESIQLLEKVLTMDPHPDETLVNLMIAYEQTCCWDKLDALYERLDRSTRQALAKGDLPFEDPMLNIRRSNDLALARAVSQAWSQNCEFAALRLSPPFTHMPPREPKQRITIGYLSYDFRNHPVAHQIFPLFGLHDRSRFRIVGFSMGPDDGSTYRKAIETHCDRFIDISTAGLAEAANTIHREKVDILIDLMGHTRHNRMGILALRPAPLQIGYLGFLSTTGADFIDYLIADDVVVPQEHRDYYSEQIIRMPDCYQINRSNLSDNASAAHRADWDLPEKAFVFCCFNVPYKIDRAIFDLWMRILKQTPQSILWLFGANQLAIDHMRRRAVASGVDPQRLVFADQRPLDEHLKRLPLADLALDTLRYNGGATTANALSVGLPVLAMEGCHWVSNMSASHLIAAGLPELVASSPEAYELAAVTLAKDKAKLRTLRDKLARNHETHALFDSRRFVKHLENGYETVWRRYSGGAHPVHIDLSEISSAADQPKDAPPENPAIPADFNIGSPVEEKKTVVEFPDQHCSNIYYYLPDSKTTPEVKMQLQQHVGILHDAGFPVFWLGGASESDRPDTMGVSCRSLEQIGADPNAAVVIPEGMPGVMDRLKELPIRRFVIAIEWHSIFSTLPDGLDWRHFKVERALVISPAVGRMISWSMDLPVHLLDSSIDHHSFSYDPDSKAAQVAFIRRKAFNIDRFMRLLWSRNHDYLNKIKWIELDGSSRADHVAQINRSSLLINTVVDEGFPTSCLEAMAAGAIVAGYRPVGGEGILCGEGADQNCLLSQIGDYVSLAYLVEPVLKDVISDKLAAWEPMISRARQTALSFDVGNERSSLIAFWRQCGFNPHGKEQMEQKQPIHAI